MLDLPTHLEPVELTAGAALPPTYTYQHQRTLVRATQKYSYPSPSPSPSPDAGPNPEQVLATQKYSYPVGAGLLTLMPLVDAAPTAPVIEKWATTLGESY